jgi:hypothetical protein
MMHATLLALCLLAPSHATRKPVLVLGADAGTAKIPSRSPSQHQHPLPAPPVPSREIQQIQVKLRDLIELVPREGAKAELAQIEKRLAAIEARLTAIEARLPAPLPVPAPSAPAPR